MPKTQLDEWGNPNDSYEFQVLNSWSPYDNIRKEEYPAMWITASKNDRRIPVLFIAFVTFSVLARRKICRKTSRHEDKQYSSFFEN